MRRAGIARYSRDDYEAALADYGVLLDAHPDYRDGRRARAGLLAILRDGLPAGTAMGILGTGEPGAQTTRLTDDHGTFLSAVTSMRYKNRGWRGSPTSRSGSTGASTTNRSGTAAKSSGGASTRACIGPLAIPKAATSAW